MGYISGTRTVYVEHSYADCYLYASGTTGGLIGSCIGTADITLRDCYTAGFQEADVMAGLVGGELSYGDVIDTCYSASARLNGSEKLTYSTAKPADVTTGKPDITSTYYMSHGDHDMDGTVFLPTMSSGAAATGPTPSRSTSTTPSPLRPAAATPWPITWWTAWAWALTPIPV